jgi:DNA helicase II / ATP-dependent DNA helicase PcrA
MDKRLILAVAGSGKTTYLVDQLSESSRTLIITYTNNNLTHLRNAVIRKFGFIPSGIKLYTYFKFAYSFCYKPHLALKVRAKGINFDAIPARFATGDSQYITSGERFYHNRIAKYFITQGILTDIKARIEKYYDAVYIDEIQDFGGNDFNILPTIASANVNVLFVGDFYQHTFNTSSDGPVNKNLYADLTKYIARFKKMGLTPDNTSLVKSRRLTADTCRLINQYLGIGIEPYHPARTSKVTETSDSTEIAGLMSSPDVVKLFYREHHKYNCYSRNWAECKGEEFDSAVVVLY